MVTSSSISARPLLIALAAGVALAAAVMATADAGDAAPTALRSADAATPMAATTGTTTGAPTGETPTPLASIVAPDRAEITAAIARGLAWLAAEQEAGGGFVGDTGHKQGDAYSVFYPASAARAKGRAHPGVTGFAGMAFLAAGHVPGRGPYGRVVERMIDYLLAGDPSDEYISDSESNMYGHAFAVLFLAQAEGMARGRDQRILPRLRAAAHLVERCQNDVGGWRYFPHAEECDLSVSVCQTQALRAAKEAGVDVKASTIKRVVEYVRESRIPYGSEKGCFYYKITGRGARSKTSFAINAAAAATLQASGIYEESEYEDALAFVNREYPDVRRYYSDHFYYWYGNWHAVQAFRMKGGLRFDAYYARIARDLLAMQRDDGRWVNRTGPGDAWSTAVACLILSVPDGLLPLFTN